MKIYRVGGSIRDELLGLISHDKDYVVVGSSPQAMIKLGFKSFGRDFPVFIHPETGDEYALARTERKTALGYTGFEFNTNPKVSLEDDLSRRDITINAIAMDETNSELIDPFGGIDDLHKGIIRHISANFTEDPLRVLRVARFSARFGFKVADETLILIEQIAKSGELQTLSKERIWHEFQKSMICDYPENFFSILAKTHALDIICPEIAQLINTNSLILFNFLKKAVIHKFTDIEIFALIAYLVSHYTDYQNIISISPPNKFMQLAKLVIKAYPLITHLDNLTYDQIVTLIKIIDPIRQKDRLIYFIKIINFQAQLDNSFAITKNISNLLLIIQMINNIDYSKFKDSPTEIEHNIYTKKIDIITQVLPKNKVNL